MYCTGKDLNTPKPKVYIDIDNLMKEKKTECLCYGIYKVRILNNEVIPQKIILHGENKAND